MKYIWIIPIAALSLSFITLGSDLSVWASNVAIVSAILWSSIPEKNKE